MQFTVTEILRLLAIVNLYPAPNRGALKFMGDLGDKLELTAEEKQKAQWQEILSGGQLYYNYAQDAEFGRDLSPIQIDNLLSMLDNPPKELPWQRQTKVLYDALVKKLGGRAVEEEAVDADG